MAAEAPAAEPAADTRYKLIGVVAPKSAAAAATAGGLAALIPKPLYAAAGTPETTKAILGFIALTDSSPLIVAKEKGFYAKHGMPDVEVLKQASWGTTRDNLELGSAASVPSFVREAVQGYNRDGNPVGAPGNIQGIFNWPGTGQMFSSQMLAVPVAQLPGELASFVARLFSNFIGVSASIGILGVVGDVRATADAMVAAIDEVLA